MSSDVGSPLLSVVVPAHNCEAHLAGSLSLLAQHPRAADLEVVIVENASSDDSWQVAQRLARDVVVPPVRAVQSPKGLGNAYREGIGQARGQYVLLTADDLPFGCSDLDQWLAMPRTTLVLGSKAHPRSVVHRAWQRGLMSGAFRLLRLVVLGMTVRDCQGTVIAEAGWLRSVLPLLEEPGYLFSTELVHVARRQGIRAVEVPVVLRPAGSGTRIRVHDVVEMVLGLVALRRRRGVGARARAGAR